MSNEEGKKKNSFIEWIKGLGIKIKIFFVALFGIVGTILFFVINKKVNTKDILKLELKKVREEIKIENAATEVEKNNEKLLGLEERAAKIKEEIAAIAKAEDEEIPKDISNEELDDFFDNRGL
jgi:hypothetical protein